MPRVISIHHYQLKSSVTTDRFMHTLQEAQDQRLFDLPGLEGYRFVQGLKGERLGQWTAIWIYSSRATWEELWGTTTTPKTKEEYPHQWRRWEDDLLAPLLVEEPDSIRYTAYEERFWSFADT